MRLYDGLHVGGAAVANFDVFSVYDFAEMVIFREVFIDQFEELLPKIGFKRCVVGRGEPDHVPFPISLCGLVGICLRFISELRL